MADHTTKPSPLFRFVIFSASLGSVFALCIVFGHQLEHLGGVNFSSPSTWIETILAAFIIAILCGPSTILLKRIQAVQTFHGKQKLTAFRYFAFSTCGLYICWIPSLLGLYPGYFTYDAPEQWMMVANHTVTAHHPVLHTLLLGNIVQGIYSLTGSFNKAVFAYTLVQLGISGLCFAYVLTFLYTTKTPVWIRRFAFLWFTLFPTVILNLFAATKDSLFAPLFLVFALLSARLIHSPTRFFEKKRYPVFWVLITFLMSTMRNNAIYAIVIFLVLLVYILRRHIKPLLIACLAFFVLYLLYTGPFYSLIVSQNANNKEYLSVPLQQIMRVYQEKYPELTYADRELIEAAFPPAAIYLYNPKISDAVKNNVDLSLMEDHKAEYFALWKRLAIKYPDIYMNSFLENTYGFWYPKASLILSADGRMGYFSCHSLPPAQDNSKIPAIYNYYQLFGDSNPIQSSWLMLLFSPGSFFFLFLYTYAYCLYQKRTAASTVLSFVALFWLTFLLGPVALVRYVAFLYYMVPLEIYLLFIPLQHSHVS